MKNLLKTTSLCGPALLLAVAAQAQVVLPGRVALPGRVNLPVAPVPAIIPTLPAAPVLPRPADVPVLPVPALPGLPMYRLSAPVAVAAAEPVRAAVLPAPVQAAVPAAFAARSQRTDSEKATPVTPSAPLRSIERARRSFGLQGKKADPRKLQALFDGAFAEATKDAVVIVEEIERPQTLPENDLLREIGLSNTLSQPE